AQTAVYERRFIHDSYACRVGKGTLAASDRLMSFMRKVSANGHRHAWALKLDVADFFPSINKRTLCEITERAIRDPELRWLMKTLLFHDPTRDYRFQSRRGHALGPEHAHYPVPDRKSLFGNDNQRGLPIGNLTSQFWGNVYLDQVDQFIKRELRCRYYVRYVDDMMLLAESPEQLLRWREQIAVFLRERLCLELKAGQRELIPLREGVEYIGWKTWWNRRVPHRRTVGRLRTCLASFERRALTPAFGDLAYRADTRSRGWRVGNASVGRSEGERMTDVERLRATVASYSGHLRHGQSWSEWQRTWAQFPWLAHLFERDGWRQRARVPSSHCADAAPKRYADRYRRVAAFAGEGCLVFWPVGRFVEFYGPQRLAAEAILGLKTARLARGDYALTAGFPIWLTPLFAKRALRAGCAVVIVGQQPRHGSGLRVRSPVSVLLPR
ncbi:MAG: RNA-directed DNA polymerase, partial [Hyphomicrobiaceae bacterium]